MKKFLSVLSAITLAFSVSACSITETEDSSDTESSSFSSLLPDDEISPEDKIRARVLAEYPDAEITEIDEHDDGSISATYTVSGRVEVMTLYANGGVGTSGRSFYKDNFPSYEEIQEEYPDKTVLVWVIDETLYEHIAPFHTRKVNEYLDEQGCDYAVCFKPVTSYEYSPEMYPDQMLVDIKELLNNGEQIDIISPMNYDEFVLDGIYEQLDEYLETDTGQELFRSLPEKFWECLRINGGIYGISGALDIALSPDYGYYVNASLAEKYGYDITKPVLEQLDILKAVKENEKNTDVFSTYLNIDSIVFFMNVKMLSSAVYWNGDTHSAELSIENPQYIEGIRLYDTLKNEGVLKETNHLRHSESFFIWTDNVGGASIGYADMKPVEVDYFGNAVTAIPVFTTRSTVRTTAWAAGICSKSEHKEKAFELMAKIFTDPVLNNLIVYGVEGEHYILENGFVKELEPNTEGFGINPFNTYRFANQMICHRSTDNPFTPEQYINIFENAEIYEDHDFALDPKNIISELSAEYIAADKISMPKKDQTIDDVISEYRERLYAAGAQKIIDECNRQYEVYKNEKN